MGFEMVGLILGSYFLGPHVDKFFGWKDLGFVVLSLLCLAGWLFRVIWLIKRIDNSDQGNE